MVICLTDRPLQGELEHRSPKARYLRTDRKTFVKQLTRIERRQARIRRIGDRTVHRPHIEISELATRPEAHHHIGLTQKYHLHIGSYLRSYKGDPAIIVSTMMNRQEFFNTLSEFSSETEESSIASHQYVERFSGLHQ